MHLLRPWAFQLTRGYTPAGKPPSRLGKTVSLDHFIQRGKVLSLWRTIVRGCRKIPDVRTRTETLNFARDEFKRNKNIDDLTQIRYLVSTGKTQWENMERLIQGL
ncbi:hypothetical protein OIDMADRAFT_130618 [Oidiodendron maius Zn]|uniref:LYR motif-containing protein 2 n=1 Tax=Oidiodendron maius (strain Zn) TaxID=913774 RepID=A0A0C3GMZ5_OIDMZ|nr:hypothetical protein OIDMADRAFT_130618 [Oidiodendron maius Zn]